MKKSILIKCLLLALLAWLLTSCSMAAANPVQSTDYKMIPIAQWQDLKQNHQYLELKLEEAKLQASKLKNLSTELTATLTIVEEELTICKQALTNLNEHLQNVQQLQEKTRASLTKLTNQIDAEREKQKAIELRHKLQKALWAIVGYTLGKAMGEAAK